MCINWNDLEPYIRSLPKEIRDRIEKLMDNYRRTGDLRVIDMIVAILEECDDNPKLLDLVKRMR